MNMFDILKQLFTNPKVDWIYEVDETQIQPIVIQRFLALYPKTMKKARILNKFVFTLPRRMYLSAAWTLLFFDGKKMNKAPFIQYPSKKKEQDKYWFVHEKVMQQFKMSQRDFDSVKKYVDMAIESDKINWFSYYGIKNKHWHENNLNINAMKDYCDRGKKPKKAGLAAWMS